MLASLEKKGQETPSPGDTSCLRDSEYVQLQRQRLTDDVSLTTLLSALREIEALTQIPAALLRIMAEYCSQLTSDKAGQLDNRVCWLEQDPTPVRRDFYMSELIQGYRVQVDPFPLVTTKGESRPVLDQARIVTSLPIPEPNDHYRHVKVDISRAPDDSKTVATVTRNLPLDEDDPSGWHVHLVFAMDGPAAPPVFSLSETSRDALSQLVFLRRHRLNKKQEEPSFYKQEEALEKEILSEVLPHVLKYDEKEVSGDEFRFCASTTGSEGFDPYPSLNRFQLDHKGVYRLKEQEFEFLPKSFDRYNLANVPVDEPSRIRNIGKVKLSMTLEPRARRLHPLDPTRRDHDVTPMLQWKEGTGVRLYLSWPNPNIRGDWERTFDGSGDTIYENLSTGESTRDTPEDWRQW